ncbi:uncharacterized protein LOC128952648 [Oppia nitens]|uniref:uncharacterized protein LOC128952648 n=1 Tax=Oppia nitens TaxID=1686743 RepID=UPI0023DBB9C0|nr:uncharacterized protein LOC128952648 [Oppia nitens]
MQQFINIKYIILISMTIVTTSRMTTCQTAPEFLDFVFMARCHRCTSVVENVIEFFVCLSGVDFNLTKKIMTFRKKYPNDRNKCVEQSHGAIQQFGDDTDRGVVGSVFNCAMNSPIAYKSVVECINSKSNSQEKK